MNLLSGMCNSLFLNSSVGIEYSLCELICSGDPSKPLVIEGRQPVVIENFLRTKIGKVREEINQAQQHSSSGVISLSER